MDPNDDRIKTLEQVRDVVDHFAAFKQKIGMTIDLPSCMEKLQSQRIERALRQLEAERRVVAELEMPGK